MAWGYFHAFCNSAEMVRERREMVREDTNHGRKTRTMAEDTNHGGDLGSHDCEDAPHG